MKYRIGECLWSGQPRASHWPRVNGWLLTTWVSADSALDKGNGLYASRVHLLQPSSEDWNVPGIHFLKGSSSCYRQGAGADIDTMKVTYTAPPGEIGATMMETCTIWRLDLPFTVCTYHNQVHRKRRRVFRTDARRSHWPSHRRRCRMPAGRDGGGVMSCRAAPVLSEFPSRQAWSQQARMAFSTPCCRFHGRLPGLRRRRSAASRRNTERE